MKKYLYVILAFVVIFTAAPFLLTACGKPGNDGSKDPEMQPIEYEMSLNTQIRGSGANLILPVENLTVGSTVVAQMYLDYTINEDYMYYLVDWGDGMWSYNGPYAYDDNHKAVAEIRHIYRKPGVYRVKGAAFRLSDGTRMGWTEEQTLVISEGRVALDMIESVTPVASTVRGESYRPENISDGDNSTCWQSQDAEIMSQEYVGYLFDDYYTLDVVEVKIPQELDVFPANIAIEYTTDGGTTWYSLPKYYYVYPYSEGRYSINMNFPNPKGATLEFMMDGIVANGVRLICKRFSYNASIAYLSVSEMRAYGSRELLFYTSEGGSKDADLNNMWTIFGSAKTEQSMYNSLRGGATNQDPFRGGSAITASTEWFEWNGLKHMWTDYEEVIKIHEQSLIDARYGGDGFRYDVSSGEYVVDTADYNNSVSDGFIWATATDPQHLGVQNHYTNNSAFIIAARDYLLWGNGTEGFFEKKNAQGQTMYDKLDKAANYMLTTLKGSEGVMTIVDPRNAALPTTEPAASNYWDNWNFCGYQSAYENTMFYYAIRCMADIEAFRGNMLKQNYYTQTAEKIKVEFNKLFWDDAKGRYITAVSKDGKRLDFGITVINFYAVKYGLASDEQAAKIYEWLDGKRTIAGDTSQGEDIYHFIISARGNTVDISKTVPIYWWDHNGALPIGDGTWGQFGNVMQNGGTIFYITYYDIMGRFQVSADNAYGKFEQLLEEFHKDELRRYTYTEKGGYQMGVLGEFPESGLVPYTYLSGFMGVNPDVDGLVVKANLPTGMSYAGVNSYFFAGREYAIEVSKEIKAPEIFKKGDKYILRLCADKEYVITMDNRLIER